MKRIKFITTFSKNGYNLYGKTWIETFTKNVKDTNVCVDLYIDFPLEIADSRINIIDYDLVIPQHKNWLDQFHSEYKGGSFYNKKMAMRFSYKSFVMQHALQTNDDCYVIWLDGDCIFKQEQDFVSFPQLLSDKFVAVQREHNGGEDHCESGIVIFDSAHKDKKLFLQQFLNNYRIENIINMSQPYDGFLIYKSLIGINYVDLNDGYGKGGIQSDPSQTFLHPAINSRFLHNIGITGKKEYDNYESVSKVDKYFRLLGATDKRSPEEIIEIRNKLLSIRRNKK